MTERVLPIDTFFALFSEWFLVGLYFAVLLVLTVYGAHRCYLLYLYTRYRPEVLVPRASNAEFPFVTVQLPVYNEVYVVERLIDAAAQLDYPSDRLEIQVLDDSTDETRNIVRQVVARWSARGVVIHLLHRDVRAGYKAGALAAGLRRANGELIAIFDADFVPPRNFLNQALQALKDPGVGMVQARWGHLNRKYSLLTRVQALLLDAHFILEHGARSRGRCFFNFNGTAGVWRRQAIADAGGWHCDTLTEDLDLSYRAQLAGWRFVFLPGLVAPAEVPAEMNAFKIQQQRWAQGSVQTCLKVMPSILSADLPFRIKLEAYFHLTANFNCPLLLLLALLIVPTLTIRTTPDPGALWMVDILLFCLATFSLVNFYAVSQRAIRRDWVTQLKYIPLAMAVGIGLSVNNTRAVIAGLRGGQVLFNRTPKYGIVDRNGHWANKRYNQGLIGQALVELVLGLYFTLGVIYALSMTLFTIVPFLCLFQIGFLYMGIVSLIQQYLSTKLALREQMTGD